MTTSPDVTPYVDLSLYDRDPQTLFEDALATLEVLLGDFVARESATEVMLMEAIAEEVSYLIFAANRVPGSVVSVILQLMGLDVLEGIAASATFQFNGAVDTGFTVPAGTRVQVDISATNTVTFETDVELVVPNGSTSGTVPATATEVGTDPHVLSPGAAVNVVDALAYVEGAELDTAPSGGRDPETDVDFLSRGTERLLRLTEALVLVQHFERYMLEQEEVFRAKALDLYDPATGPAPGDNTGHTTVAVAKTAGGTFTADEKTAFEQDMESRAHAGLDVHVVDPDFFAVDVTVTVVREESASAAAVEEAVEDALSAEFDPDSWGWGETIYYNEIISLVDNVIGVRRVVSLTIGLDGGAQGTSDLTLDSFYPLTTAGALSVTVDAP